MKFMSDLKTQDAVVRNLEVIGEATKNLASRLREAYPSIPWKDMAGMRDKVIHHYFGVNYDIVWTVASQEIPALRPSIEDILARERNDDEGRNPQDAEDGQGRNPRTV